MEKTPFFKANKPYLTRFSRIFSVQSSFGVFLGLILGIFFFLFLWKNSVALSPTMPPFSPFAFRNTKSSSQRCYEEWKLIVEKHPDYRDGYVLLAWCAQQLGMADEAKTYLHKVMAVDPSYQIPEVFTVGN